MGVGQGNINENRARQWDKARNSYRYYQAYIESKPDTYRLGLLDLLYVSNFKAGQASTNEPVGSLRRKLEVYTEALRSIHREFGARDLRELDDDELERLIAECQQFLGLTVADETNIDGLGPSYASGLLHFHFPDLLPILDKWVVRAAGIAQADEEASAEHYGPLICYAHHDLVQDPDKTIRQLDRELFIDP